MKKILLLLLSLILSLDLIAQDSGLSDITVNGYVKYMNTAMFNQPDSIWLVDNLIHNRINFKWYMNDHFTLALGMRNRIIYGDFVKSFPGYAGMVENDDGYLNFLTNNIIEEQSYIITSTFDRAYLEYATEKLNITLGRQRINWGQSFVWNPNDIFNSYSFFDFDYEERPGSDALRIQYFPNYTSVVDISVKIDKDNNITAAGLYRFNKWGYDLQVLGGIMDTSDYVLGIGWTGNITDFGFYGEATYFHPQDNFRDSTGVVLTSVGLSYMFANSLYIQVEGMYNGYFDKINLNSLNNLYFSPLTVKTSSYSEFSWFAQVSYPIHPLLNGTIAFMYLPSLGNGYFLMPSLSYSVSDNFEFSLYGQHFEATFNGNYDKMTMIFMRFRWSF